MIDLDEELLLDLAQYAYDPLGFVLWAFPWGEEGTELATNKGPEPWQREILEHLRDGLLTLDQAIRIAVTSGHGVGKSALVSWIVWWAFSTFPGTRGVVTANTENQLKTKTWVEIAKWHRLFIARHLFKCTATALFSVDEDRSREWRIDIVPWSERNTEAFAGLHNQGKRLVILFDEASAIPDIIWETTEGAITDLNTEIIWACFGNPTKNTGRFRECFPGGKFAARWFFREVDSRAVSFTNKAQIAEWISDYGIDSDFIKVRVLGKFPLLDNESFIALDTCREAAARLPLYQENMPIVLGVDVARFGDDKSVIYARQGRDARSRPPEIFSGLDTVQLASRVIQTMNRYNAVAVCVDGTGVGGGVVDQLRTRGVNVYEVQFAARADGLLPGQKFANKRAEIWGVMRDWLRTGSIVNEISGLDHTFSAELTSPGYSFIGQDSIQLESKDMMRRRGAASPDIADALACTFAFAWLDDMPLVGVSPQQNYKDYNPLEAFHA